MVTVLVGARLSYFFQHAGGTTLNYFSKDMDVIDEMIPMIFFNMLTIFLQIGSVIVLLILANVWISWAILLFILGLSSIRKFYVTTSRDLKRMDGES
jgi:ATP-binding cassette subfamily C (CFTR/MRP) protein 4